MRTRAAIASDPLGKLRDKDHFIRLMLKASEPAEIDSWLCSDTGPWIANAAGEPMSGEALDRFLRDVPALKGLNLKPHRLRCGRLRPTH